MTYKGMGVHDMFREVSGGMEVNVMVSPNSDTQGTDGTNEWRKRLVIRVRSPPLDGKANKEAEEYIKKITGCTCEIIRGHMSRQKTVMVYGDPADIMRSLERLI